MSVREFTAIFYIYSRDYTKEVERSVESILKAHPGNRDYHFYYIMPKEEGTEEGPWRLLFERQSEFWYVDSASAFARTAYNLMTRGYLRALYLDTDTFCLGELEPMMQILDKFDFAGAQAPGRVTRRTTVPIPRAFPELNLGVNPFRLNGKTCLTLIDWAEHYARNANFYGNNDQASLREVLWDNSNRIRVGVLPPEYNFRFGFGGWLRDPALFLHGRSPSLESIGRKVNNPGGMRAFQNGELG